MKIPFIDFSPQYQTIKEEVLSGVESVFEKGNFILGQEVKEFESDFAAYCDSQYCAGVNSGTDALYLALSALGVGAGDEVIVPTHTFIATALAVSYTQASPVFVDIRDDIYNMDPDKIEDAITPKTKAIIAVHLYGQAANMDEINAVAKKHNLKVIEDAAQAHGSTYKGRKIGSLGDVACFSFYPTKSLGGFGDGGSVVTKDSAVYEKLLMLRDYGRKGRYEHIIKGHNSRLDTVQAVVLAAKLKHLDEWNEMRRAAGAKYSEQLANIEGVVSPVILDDRTHVFQTYAVRVPQRDKVCEELQKRNIGVLIHYPILLHLQEAYKEMGGKVGDFPVAEKVADEILSLPMFPHISDEQIDFVCQNLKEVLMK